MPRNNHARVLQLCPFRYKPGCFCAPAHGNIKREGLCQLGSQPVLSAASWLDALTRQVVLHFVFRPVSAVTVQRQRLSMAVSALPRAGFCHMLEVDSVKKDQVNLRNKCKMLPFGILLRCFRLTCATNARCCRLEFRRDV